MSLPFDSRQFTVPMMLTMPMVPRQVPPTATPLNLAAWQRGLGAPPSAVDDFAAALGEYLDVRHVLLASSGRTALRLLLDTVARQPQWGERTEVIIPGYTCPALAKVILDARLTPRLVDLDPATFTYPPAALSSAVSDATLAILVVHPFGIPVAVGPALAAARAVGALVIEDAAQAMGARVDGRHVGTRGHVGLYSLGPGKALALGGGGVVVTNDDALASLLREEWQSLHTPAAAVAQMASAAALLRLGLFHLAFQPPLWWFATKLGAQKVGGNEASWGYRLSGFTAAQAAVGLELLPRLDAINQQRRDHARQLLAGLAGLVSLSTPGIAHVPASESGTGKNTAVENTKQPIYLRLPLLTSTLAQANGIFRTLSAAGIGVGRMYGRTIPGFFPQLPGTVLSGTGLPGSERVAQTLLTLPTNHHLTAAEVERIPELIRRALLAE